MDTRRGLLIVGAAAVLATGYMHFYLYFWGGYRGISIDRLAGIDISRSFALNAVAGLLIAEALALSLRYERLAAPAAALGILFAAAAIAGYTLARTSGLLGFTESGWSSEAVIAMVAEVLAIVSLASYLVISLRRTKLAPVT